MSSRAAIMWRRHSCLRRRDSSRRSVTRDPDVVEFVVTPEVGQAVLACPPVLAEPSPLPKEDRGQASTARPTEQGMGQRIFPSHPKLRGDLRSSEPRPRTQECLRDAREAGVSTPHL